MKSVSSLYKFVRPVIFQLDSESAHHLAMNGLRIGNALGLSGIVSPGRIERPVECFGLRFPNAIGLAAGFDKNGDAIDALGELGFGFLELGTVTPRPQPGNPKPRLFRLPQARAIINRMGFNNKGVDYLVNRLEKSRFKGVRGVNIGKNFDTPLEQAHQDYLICYQKVYPHADYIVVNVSSPNTEGLRSLQTRENLKGILEPLLEERRRLSREQGTEVPLLVKIAPDLSEQELNEIAQVLPELGLDGVIATNTTISRDAVAGLPYAQEKGGLSGAPLQEPSREVVTFLRNALGPDFPIIGVGGLMSAEDARKLVDAGANLLQVYTGLIYQGPNLIRQIAEVFPAK